MVAFDDVRGECRRVEGGPGVVVPLGESAEFGDHEGGIESGIGARVAEGSPTAAAVVEPVSFENVGGRRSWQ